LKSLRGFAFYLVTKIEHPVLQRIFEHCIPAIELDYKVLEMLLPYIVYYAIRFSDPSSDIVSHISKYVADILSGSFFSHVDSVFKVIDFLRLCEKQDKALIKKWLESGTKFKYTEKLFQLKLEAPDSKRDASIVEFCRLLDQNEL